MTPPDGTRSSPSPLTRYVALGDSQTEGVGDPLKPGVLRGWAAILAATLRVDHPDLQLHNLARTGAVVADVRRRQLPAALAAGPDLVSLLIGVNDALRPRFDATAIATDLHTVLDALLGSGATILVLRLHDPAALLPLPPPLRRRLRRRVDAINDALDAALDRVRGEHVARLVVLDLAAEPASRLRNLFTIDRLHLNPRGHHALAEAAVTALFEADITERARPVHPGQLRDYQLLHARWLLQTARRATFTRRPRPSREVR